MLLHRHQMSFGIEFHPLLKNKIDDNTQFILALFTQLICVIESNLPTNLFVSQTKQVPHECH